MVFKSGSPAIGNMSLAALIPKQTRKVKKKIYQRYFLSKSKNPIQKSIDKSSRKLQNSFSKITNEKTFEQINVQSIILNFSLIGSILTFRELLLYDPFQVLLVDGIWTTLDRNRFGFAGFTRATARCAAATTPLSRPDFGTRRWGRMKTDSDRHGKRC